MEYFIDNNAVVETATYKDSTSNRHKAYYDLLVAAKDMRLKSGISQSQIAKMLGMNQDKISNYESGKISPRLDVYLRYLEALGYTLKIIPKGGN